MIRMKPRGNLVLIDILPQTEEKEGAIFLPENRKFLAHAEVLALPPGIVQAGGAINPIGDLKVGDVVLVIAKQPRPSRVQGGMELTDTGTPVMDGGKRYFLMEEAMLLAVVGHSETVRGPQLVK